MGHVVLLGDSIFDNARYVPDKPPVIEQVRRGLPAGWKASLLARDGHIVSDVPQQLAGLPEGATHVFISAGGNDALGESAALREVAGTVGEALELLHEVQARFQRDYHDMLRIVLALDKPTVLCTIYDAIPTLEVGEKMALGAFNDVILRAAFLARLPVIDLRLVCDNAADYSPLSPIEPSVVGGAKIACVIAEVATSHDFARRQCVVYS